MLISHSSLYPEMEVDYAYYLSAFQAIQKLSEGSSPVIIAIDGRCASGKSMLANRLSEVFECNLFHMDDFFLPIPMRTRERLSQPGGNVDYERFMKEVLKPLSEGQNVCFQPFDCATGTLKPPVYKSVSSITIVEGSYSLHPQLTHYYDYRIFMTCTPDMQKRRISIRNGQETLQQFLEKWIPMEEHYFKEYAIADQCNLQLDTTDLFGEQKILQI